MKHSIKDQLAIEIKSLFAGYPKFVYSKNNIHNLDGIPVFVYHTIEPELFEAQLQYLKTNGYKTLSIYEFYDVLTKKKSFITDKMVLLTIDDARSSVWRYAYPLLEKYQMHATVFVIPGVTEEGKPFRKNLKDNWNNNSRLKEIDNIDKEDNTLCNWAEIKEMYNSGFVNIESHTLFHREIFKSTKIVNYISNDTSVIPYNFIGSPYYVKEKIGEQPTLSEYAGLPLFESDPLMFAGQKMEVSMEFISKCKDIYNNSNGNDVDWKNQINNFVALESNNNKYFNYKNNSKKDTLEDLKLAREEIQKHLDSDAGNHLCLPWTKGNNKTVDICKELNIKSCFWGVLDNKKINRAGDDPYFVSRIKNDFIFRLPGEGRESLLQVYSYKIKRRLSGEKVY